MLWPSHTDTTAVACPFSLPVEPTPTHTVCVQDRIHAACRLLTRHFLLLVVILLTNSPHSVEDSVTISLSIYRQGHGSQSAWLGVGCLCYILFVVTKVYSRTEKLWEAFGGIPSADRWLIGNLVNSSVCQMFSLLRKTLIWIRTWQLC